ncbi:hypothetical protein BBK82_35545 [Lentzea guizhouensis]|uniref:Condensation domain-containing protein n=1 Tax=Lentzea guizhouensis TaxID=1586287 RepID=A0A1B2HZZ9_9PSEU|nr:hypothetical protein [Lentzea guizhouensis]ANZ43284.1 hypothetical protein BBK82_35545 [Lentzea guizhouensis]
MHRSITRTYRKHFADVHSGAEDGADVMPLTGAQRRFHHTRSTDPLGRVKVVPVLVEFPPGALSARRLDRAARAAARRHPRCAGPHVIRGVPVLRTGPPDIGPVVEVLPGPDSGHAMRSALDRWPAGHAPFRVLLARDDRRDLLALAFDHIVCDEASIGQVLGQIAAGYDTDVDVPDAEVAEELSRYRHAVESQLDHEHEASGPDALAHWTSRIRDAAPGRWGRDPGGGGGSASEWRRVELSGAAAGRGTLFTTLLATCHAALAEHDGTAPVCYTWGGRAEPSGAGTVVGCFLNTVVAHPPGEHSELLEDVRSGWWEDLEWADTPFDEVVRAARATGARWAGHLDLMLTLDDRTRRPVLVLGGTPGRETYLPGMRVGTPVVVSASYDKHELHLRVDHDPLVVPAGFANRVTDRLVDAVQDRGHVAR